MTPTAIIFGGLGVLTELGDLERQAVEAASVGPAPEGGWVPTSKTVAGAPPAADKDLRKRSGEILRDMLSTLRLPLRPGLAEVVAATKATAVPLVLISEVDAATTGAVLDALSLDRANFAHVICDTRGAGLAFERVRDALGLQAGECMAVADTPESAEAALAAGMDCIAFPGSLRVGERFGDVTAQVQVLAPRTLNLIPPDAPRASA